jgi:hypothetical protein
VRNHIAYIADKITRHYCIKIDHANAFVSIIEQHIADLCIMVRNLSFKWPEAFMAS